MMTPTILVCDNAVAPRTRLDVLTMSNLLRQAEPPLTIDIVDALCTGYLPPPRHVQRLVLGVCSHDLPTADLQRWARRADLDPFAAETVPLSFAAAVARTDPLWGQNTAALQLAASAARLAAFPGSDPDQLRMRFNLGPVSRRTLLSLPPVVYEPVARVDQEACLGSEQCGLCVSACPVASISATDGRVTVDQSTCTACGICVTRCPTEAITLPGASLHQYEARLRTILSMAGPFTGPIGILITPSHTASVLDALPESTPITPGWIPVDVPALRMVTAGWLLQALAAGATAVAVGASPDDSEDLGVMADRVDYCRQALAALGHDADGRLRILPSTPAELAAGLDGLPRDRLVLGQTADVTLREPQATAYALLSLSAAGPPPTPVPHASSPLGVVRIDHAKCAMCGACAAVCPTRALTLQDHEDDVWLELDPTACNSCQHCVSVCPEHAVAVRAETDVTTLARGRVVPKTSAITRCTACGRPIALDALIRRVQGFMADFPAELLDRLSTLCGDCRGFAATGGRP